MKKEQTVRYMTTAAMIAALYTALTLLFAPFGFGPIQCRISEALVILPYFTPAAIPGVTIGCFLGNLFAGAVPMDVVFGTLASLLGAIGSYTLRRHRFWVCVPPIVSNTLIVPWVLKIAYGAPELVPYLMVTVGIGEVIAAGGLGTVLLLGLEKYPMLFRTQPGR